MAQPESHSPDQLALDHIEALHSLVQVVRSLPQPYRSALVLQYVVGMGPAEAAEALGVKRGTLRSRVHRGLEMVRTELAARKDGHRRPWQAALVPLVRGLAPATAGGAVVSTKKTVLVLVCSIFFLGAGLLIWLPADRGSPAQRPRKPRLFGAEASTPARGGPILVRSGAAVPPAVDPQAHDRVRVTVAVVDEYLKPRAGVSVRIRSLAQWWKDASPVKDWPDDGILTASNGEVVLHMHRGDEIVGVYDTADGASSTAACAGSRCRLVLARRRPLRILVRSATGDAIEGASVLMRDGTSTNRWNRGFREQKKTDAEGAAEFLLPSGRQGAWVRAYREDVGFGSALLDTGSGTRTLVLRGRHDARFRLQSSKPVPGALFTARFIVRVGSAPTWEFSRSVRVGEEVPIGRLPDGARVTLVASSPSGQVAHDDWEAATGVRLIPVLAGCSLTVRATPLPGAPYPRAAIAPPASYAEFLDFADARPFDGKGRVVFNGLPAIPGDWLFVAWGEDQRPLEVSPRTFELQDLQPGESKEIEVRLGEGRGLTIEGVVKAEGSGAPIPLARVMIANPYGPPVQITDASGRFSFQTSRLPPFPLYFRREGFLPAQGVVDSRASSSGRVQLNALMQPTGSDETYAVTVRVEDDDGGPVPGAMLAWTVGGLPVGRTFLSSESPAPAIRLPRGPAVLRVTPPSGGSFRPYADEYLIANDADLTVVLQRVGQTAGFHLRLRTAEPLREQFGLLLSGKHNLWGNVRSGEARVANVPEGRYRLELRIGPVAIPMGDVEVAAPLTSVERVLGEIVALNLAVGVRDEPKTRFHALLKSIQGGVVLAEARGMGSQVLTWMVPEGEYEIELIQAGRHGAKVVHVRKGAQERSVSVPSARPAGTAIVGLAGQGRAMLALRLDLEGPVHRQWRTHIRQTAGKVSIEVAGLPSGTYVLHIETTDERLAGSARFDMHEGESAVPVELHLSPR